MWIILRWHQFNSEVRCWDSPLSWTLCCLWILGSPAETVGREWPRGDRALITALHCHTAQQRQRVGPSRDNNGNTATYSTLSKKSPSARSKDVLDPFGEQKCEQTHQTVINEAHLSCQVVPRRQVLESEKAVPLTGSTPAGVGVHDLSEKHRNQQTHQRNTFNSEHLDRWYKSD